ncbi:elongation factor G [Roseiconus lacunae]|uniref:Elongation factor G n=1 Tax=Roseiconus lacunae TaxID=2605694 RepID=A0ABT7PHM8_9BACT|nr:elongation factor G [Roseiconus lacunae]MCD0461178.1 elongation factor G [Roseiconus lacunae]MDM4016004.1 elongation factor G [Roseiconus lacunae]WRQ51664.1 elongation factor G [Stieleria sp. HD01]
MSADITKLRNIGIIAHIDAGKTTVTERMLFLSGAKHRVGRVDHGTTDTDDDPEEQERGITIFSACVKFHWNDHNINLLDTPGHVDFTAEVERCLRVLDGAVVVFSAREGVEAQSETVWRQADRYNVPRIVFINKMDREGANFDSVFSDIEPRLGGRPVAVELPVGQGPAHVNDPFRGVIDLVEMKALQFDPETEGKSVTETDIPDELIDDALLWREQLLETVCEIDEEAMALVMEDQEIPVELIRSALRKGCIEQTIQPVLCGSALHGIGVQPLMTAVGHYLPSPIDRPPVEGVDPKKPEKSLLRKPDPSEPFSALVFKILPAKTGDNYWIRIYSGALKQNSRVFCPNRDKKENVAQLWQIHASKKERDGQVETITAGDICCVIGPRFAITGDTLCDSKDQIELPSIKFADTVLSMAIEPENTGDRKKLDETLDMLRRQDPTFKAVENEELGQTLISGMGELHLEVIQHRLTRDFGLNVKFYKPRVNYRETIGGKADVTGVCNRQMGASQMFARLKIRVEATEDSSTAPLVFDRLPPDCPLPNDVRTAAIEELRERAAGGGVLAGFPLSGIKIEAYDVEVHEEGSDEVAFRIAAGDAFDKAMNEAGPVLLEPVMKVEVTTPEDYMGELVGDLQQRRALIAATETRGAMTVITANAPLKELFGYSSAVRSLSQGRAGSSMEPLGYQPAPKEDLEAFQY